MGKTKNCNKKLQNYKNNAKKHNLNIKIYVKASIQQLQEIKNYLPS